MQLPLRHFLFPLGASRKMFFFILINCTLFLNLILFSGCSSNQNNKQLQEQPPNVIIILTDDMGYGDISAYGQMDHLTPHIDQLASQGALFTDFYVPVPYCAPSRASLLTGRFPLRHGLIQNPTPDSGPANDTIGIAADEHLLSEILQAEGYRTKLVGKWHLGHQPKFFPTQHGFDEFYGILYSNDMRPVQIMENADTVEYPVDQRLITQKYTAQALDFIERHKERPFFLHLCHAMPHKPLAASEDFYTPETPEDLYDDVIRELDWSVGQVMDKLKTLDLLDNTIVIFMSDNGGSWGGSNGGLKGKKSNTWEGGTRVPFMIRAKQVPAKVTIHIPAWSMDIFPTLLHLLGIALPEDRTLDGTNLLDIIQGTQTEHAPVFALRRDRVMTVRSGDWKLFLKKPSYYTGPDPNYQKSWDARKPDSTTILAPEEQPTPDLYPGIKPLPFDTFPLLFNLRDDPAEMTNLADKYPERVAALQAEYDRFFSSMMEE